MCDNYGAVYALTWASQIKSWIAAYARGGIFTGSTASYTCWAFLTSAHICRYIIARSARKALIRSLVTLGAVADRRTGLTRWLISK